MRWILVVGAFVLGVAGVGAAPRQTPVFRAGVDHVAVDVVVTDGKNAPVTGLTAADFQIVEHGRPQAITDFKYIDIPVAHRTVDLKQAPAPTPDVATNALPSPNSRLFVMVVDDLHLIESAIVPVERVMTDFLQALSPDDEVGMVFVGHSDLSVNVTRDVGRLLTAVRNVRAAFGFGIGPTGSLLGSGGNLDYARSVAWELRNISQALAQSGHVRRAIVLVSGGTPLDPGAPIVTSEYRDARTYQQFLDDAFEAAKRADVPIYTLDPRGLVSPDTAVRGWGHTSAAARAEIQRRIGIQQDHIAEIAINTGGRFFINQSNLAGAVKEIVGENGSFYLLGYSPDPYTRDGKFHDISVKVTRPGLTVRARKGYVAAEATTGDASAIDAAMGAGANVGGLTLHAWAAPVAAAPRGQKGMTTAVTVEVVYPAPPGGSGRVDDTLQMNILALGPDGEVRARSSRPWEVAGRTGADGTATFAINDAVLVPSQALTLRVGVASRVLGRAGTVQMPLDVPHLDSDKLQISGLVIGLASGQREPALGATALATLVPFQPTAVRVFTAADTIRIFARAFWGGKALAATAVLSLTGAATVPPRPPLALVPTSSTTGRREAVVDVTQSLAGLAPGEYAFDLAVTIDAGRPVHRVVPFAIR